MNLKIANLVAIQFGIFVGMMAWLGYSRLPSAAPRSRPETRERTPESAAPFAPVFEPGDQRSEPADDYRADREPAQTVAEQRAQAVREYSALAAQLYYQQIAPRRYVSSGLENNFIVADAPSYTEAVQATAEVLPEDVAAPETVAYIQPFPIVAFSNSGRFPNRRRSAPFLNCAPPTITRQFPNRRNSRPGNPRIVPGPNISAPPRPPVPGPRPRGGVRSTAGTGGQQKSVAFPTFSGPAQHLAP